ncbi:MAG: hypothetical protein GWO24_07880, partial [Akkermansiaceae bacterium]|nr:hypothetical protein [Akkermansiaceae bacterium]
MARSVQGAMAEHAEREERMQAMRRASAESAIGYDLNKMAIELENAERQNRGVDAIGSSTRYLNNMNSALEQYRRENRRKYD